MIGSCHGVSLLYNLLHASQVQVELVEVTFSLFFFFKRFIIFAFVIDIE